MFISKFKLSKKIRMALAGGLSAAVVFFAPLSAPVAEATLLTDVIGGIIGIGATYNYYLTGLLAIGNDPGMQKKLLDEDMAKAGQDLDERDNEVVTSVMNQLLERGDYALPADSLPFRWRVNNSDQFNASCSAVNYVSVNKGFLAGVNYNRDEVAGVLAHELIHGLHQHVQYDGAKAAATQYGASLLQANTGILESVLIQLATNYNQAKNYTAPSENDADKSGFFLMASAGFNPGGFAAMVTKMPDSPSESFLNPDDHPETSKRLERALKWMEEYSVNHVTCATDEKTGNTDVLIDEKVFYTAQPLTEEQAASAGEKYSAKERAYFIAGGLAKAFHDNSMGAMWGFRKMADGSVDFLNDDEAYAPLKSAVRWGNLGADLEARVTAAYAKERKNRDRERMMEDELKRKEDIEKKRKKAQKNNSENVSSLASKAATYNSMGLSHLARHEATRLLACDPENVVGKKELVTALNNPTDESMALSDKAMESLDDEQISVAKRYFN